MFCYPIGRIKKKYEISVYKTAIDKQIDKANILQVQFYRLQRMSFKYLKLSFEIFL